MSKAADPSRVACVLRCLSCGRQMEVLHSDVPFLLRIDWPHCCGSPLIVSRAPADSDPATPAEP